MEDPLTEAAPLMSLITALVAPAPHGVGMFQHIGVLTLVAVVEQHVEPVLASTVFIQTTGPDFLA